jgi:bifunctional pyridoxal-dependent enzyme with beta-cystathionase and maltose regulon repressor activities
VVRDLGAIFGELEEGHQRILIGTSEEIINETLERMEKVLNELKRTNLNYFFRGLTHPCDQ